MSSNQPVLPENIRVILFDLGNTLYDKSLYLTASFNNVADYLNKTLHLDKKTTLGLLKRIWKINTSHYEFLFKDLLDILGAYSAKLLDEILVIYHSTNVRLKPYAGVPQLFIHLKKHFKIGLVTDGHAVMQRNKIKLLGWEKQGKPFDIILYTADYDKSYLKPNPFVYQLAVEKLGVAPKEVIYVGDNPYDDFIGAKEIGVFTIRILSGEFKDVKLDKGHESDITIKNILQLRKLLAPLYRL